MLKKAGVSTIRNLAALQKSENNKQIHGTKNLFPRFYISCTEARKGDKNLLHK